MVVKLICQILGRGQSPLLPTYSGIPAYEVRHSSKIGGWKLKKGKATSEHLHLCYGSEMAIRTTHKYFLKHFSREFLISGL